MSQRSEGKVVSNCYSSKFLENTNSWDRDSGELKIRTGGVGILANEKIRTPG